jgi:hypothetical protein
MKLPNRDRAVVQIEKLRDYSLSPEHEEGKHKARVFAAALGIGQEDAEWLRDQLLAVAVNQDCELGKKTQHGQRYTIEFVVEHGEKSAKRCGASGTCVRPRISLDWSRAMCYRCTVQNTPVKLLDVIALLKDRAQDRLVTGQVGTVVEVLAPGVFEVEFRDSQGKTIALAELRREELLVLKHEPATAA